MLQAVEIQDLNLPKDSGEKQVLDTQKWGVALLFLAGILLVAFVFSVHIRLVLAHGGYYKQLAASNRLTKRIIKAPRGVVLDSSGKKLVENRVAYDLYYSPREISVKDVVKKYPEIKEMLGKRYNDLLSSENTVFAYERLLVHKIPRELAVKIKVEKPEGLFIRESAYRYYPYKQSMAHVLGYTGLVYAEDIQKDPTLLMDDTVGREGLEAYYDKLLRGKHGEVVVETNKYGEKIAELSNSYKAPEPGVTLKLFLKLDWQKRLYKHLASAVNSYHARGGAAVILDVNTGGVIAMASYPSYDNNWFIGGISRKKYAQLVKDKRYPLLNRAIAAQEPAGSTFKTIVAAAALNEGAITPSTRFNSTGVIYLAGNYPFQEYHKHRYGWLTVREALMVSSNIFFCRTMLKLGIDKFIPYAERFGIGHKTGVDLPGEAPGRLPSPENKIYLAKHGYTWLDPIWYPEGDSCNTAIGQGITLVTPIQLASIAATIANGGTVYKPQLVKEFIYPDGRVKKYEPMVKASNFVKKKNLRIVAEGMRLSVAGPRAISRVLNHVPVKVAAKTGTAEFGIKTKDGYLSTHAWVMGFWPYEHPKYAFAVLLEGGGPSIRSAIVMANFLKEVY